MPITPANPFKGRQYSGEVILLAVRWYLRYPLAYEHVAEMLAERGLEVDASCIWRWVQAYAPEINKRCRPHLRRTNKSYRVDETYIKVKHPRQIVNTFVFHRNNRESRHNFLAALATPSCLRGKQDCAERFTQPRCLSLSTSRASRFWAVGLSALETTSRLLISLSGKRNNSGSRLLQRRSHCRPSRIVTSVAQLR
jgi:hypothetical protein